MRKSLTAAAEAHVTAPPAATATAADKAAQDPDVVQQELNNHDEEYYELRKKLPAGVDVEDAITYGFYEYRNRYWMRKAEDMFIPVSNFTMRVLYLIVGANPKRIVEISNVHKRRATIDFSIEDLISIEKFKARVESQGNYLFEGNAAHLARIKNKLYTLERPSIEIGRLGQYKDLFFVWANGIYTGTGFVPVDDKGMAEVNGEHYYIPVFGSTRADDDDDLRNYRRFLHRESATTFAEWTDLFVTVYGTNGYIGIGFYFFSVFSDLIFERTKAAPMLFLFGQRGSGKGTMANSLMTLFGHPQDPLMLGGASTVGRVTQILLVNDDDRPAQVDLLVYGPEGLVASPTKMQSQADVVPAIRDDVFSGYKLRTVKPGSTVAQLGFRSGDKVTHVNGRDLTNDAEALAVYLGLSSTKTFKVRYVRDGQTRTKTIKVE